MNAVKGMDAIYGIVQFYQLASGESSVHVDGYSTRELAEEGLEKEVSHLKEEIVDSGYEVDEEHDDGCEVYIKDTKDNRYSLKLEAIHIKK